MIDRELNCTTCDDNITYVVGLWIVTGNTKRSREHYLDRLPATLRLLKNKRVLFLYNDTAVAESAKKNLETPFSEFQEVSLSHMVEMTSANKLLEMAKKFQIVKFASMKAEKGQVHYKRDLMGSGEQAYKQIISIWLSKVFLVTDIAIKTNPFQSSSFAWVDASLSRFDNDRVTQMLAEPVHPTKVLLARSGMRYRGKRLRFNASHILATAENWLKLREYYESELMKSLNEAYPIDEEVLLERVGRLHPNFLSLFRLYGNKPRYNKREFENLKNLYYQAAFHMFVWISKASILSRKK